VKVLELRVRESGDAAGARLATVLGAYADVERARTSRRLVWCAIPVLSILLIAVQASDGLLALASVERVLGLGAGVAAAAAREEWRAAKRLRALIRHPSDIS